MCPTVSKSWSISLHQKSSWQILVDCLFYFDASRTLSDRPHFSSLQLKFWSSTLLNDSAAIITLAVTSDTSRKLYVYWRNDVDTTTYSVRIMNSNFDWVALRVSAFILWKHLWSRDPRGSCCEPGDKSHVRSSQVALSKVGLFRRQPRHQEEGGKCPTETTALSSISYHQFHYNGLINTT